MLYRKPFKPDIEAPKIEVPKLDETQLFLISALSIIRATQSDLEAARWLHEFELENLLPANSLSGFLELLDVHCVHTH